MNLEARQTGYGSSENRIEQQEDIAAAIYEIIQQMNSQTELIVSTMGKLMQKFMSQNEKLMAVMVKKPPGGSARGGGRGRGYRGIRYKVPLCRELKVGDKHLYNGTLDLMPLYPLPLPPPPALPPGGCFTITAISFSF